MRVTSQFGLATRPSPTCCFGDPPARQISGTHRSRRAADQRRAPGRGAAERRPRSAAQTYFGCRRMGSRWVVPRSLRRSVIPAGIAGPASSRGPRADVVVSGRNSALDLLGRSRGTADLSRYRCCATASAFSAAASPRRAQGANHQRGELTLSAARGVLPNLCQRGRNALADDRPPPSTTRVGTIFPPPLPRAVPTRPRGAVQRRARGTHPARDR
ncbi:hypothetical protein APR11_003548 [Nocardia amikacinitolerans]|nr:hypothetical protein [Nocardia amikacinitolerans]